MWPMKLLTKEIKRRLPALYSQENEKDPMVICKFFDPSSSWTWYAIEGSPVDEWLGGVEETRRGHDRRGDKSDQGYTGRESGDSF